jgi:DNA-binding response OmpR family regulator
MRVVIADDQPDVVVHLKEIIEELGHDAVGFTDGEAFSDSISRETFDLVILDWNIRSKNGTPLFNWMCKALPKRPPVIIMTNRAAKRDITEALTAGADEYITKPEVRSVIAARVSALLHKSAPTGAFDTEVSYGLYLMNRLDQSVTLHGKTILLTAKEFELAEMFFKNANRTLSRNNIIKTIWRTPESMASRTLDMHVSRVRSKLDLQLQNGFRIVTVFGYGYRLECLKT